MTRSTLVVSNVPELNRKLWDTVPVQISLSRGTKSTFMRLARALTLGATKASGVMAKPEDYRRYAAECLRLAQGFRGRAEAAMLLEMAERWRRLAKEAESRVSTDEE
jgi:hypothetical protein